MTTLVSNAVAALAAAVRGEVLVPDDAGYNEARRVYNAEHDRRPAIIVRASGVADVIAAVHHARTHGLALAVRGGGHSIAGFSTCDDGLVLDLGGMRGIRVIPGERTARAEGGCTWGALDHATHAFGLATTGGLVSSTGIAGLTLGGGLGFLARRIGLSCDNLFSADVVTADGSFVTCDEQREPDLFWALRGGGGNFGVVTSFEYRLHPIADVLGGLTVYPLEGDVLRAYTELVAASPVEFGALLAIALGPPAPFLPERWHGRPVAIVLTCWSGPGEEDNQVLASLGRIGPVLGQLVERMPYPAVNTFFDESLPAGLHHYWKGLFTAELTDGAVTAHLEYGATVPSLETGTLLIPIDGACHRVALDATAFAYRDATFATAIGPSWSDPTDSAANIAWGRAYYDALRPHSMDGGYVNFTAGEDQDLVRTNYRQNYPRLVELKRRYDPENLFRLNHNIAP
ncbi:MAG: FAD-binding oxidoreductase [Pseudonocardiaceae bacterium]